MFMTTKRNTPWSIAAGIALIAVGLMSSNAFAVPDPGVGTVGPYITDGGSADAYQTWFAEQAGLTTTSVSGTPTTHGFSLGGSPSELYVWSDQVETGGDGFLTGNADVYLLTELPTVQANDDGVADGAQFLKLTPDTASGVTDSNFISHPFVDGATTELSVATGSGLVAATSFGAYIRDDTNGGYYGINLGPISFVSGTNEPTDGWFELPATTFSPAPMFAKRVRLEFSNGIPAGDGGHFFAVEDKFGTGYGELKKTGGIDEFTPKTTSAIGGTDGGTTTGGTTTGGTTTGGTTTGDGSQLNAVPEPITASLASIGLGALAVACSRRRD